LRAETLLRIHNTSDTLGIRLAQKIWQHGLHAGTGKQSGGIVFGNKRGGRNYYMSPALEKIQILLPNLIAGEHEVILAPLS
jgi:hypothetical protein